MSLEALQTGVAIWEPGRLEAAQRRLDALDAIDLPRHLGATVVTIVDATERPEEFRLVDLYNQQENPDLLHGDFGMLLMVNYQEGGVPGTMPDLLDAIREQRQRSNIPTAVATIGYPGPRRIDQLRTDAWDMVVAYVLGNAIESPVVGISNDADVEDISSNYLKNMVENDYVDGPATVWTTEVNFGQPCSPDLVANRMNAYLSGMRKLLLMIDRPTVYGGSMAMTLDTYASISDGWRVGKDSIYGVGEPSEMVRKLWRRSTGNSGPIDNELPAYHEHVRFVHDARLTVSPRRELLELRTYFLSPEDYAAGKLITTEPDNPYRSLAREDLEALARQIEDIEGKESRTLDYLNNLDKMWFKLFPAEMHPELGERIDELRRRLRLPARPAT